VVGNESGTVRSGDNSAHKVVQREALDFNWTEVIGGLARDATALLASGSLTGPPRLIFCVGYVGTGRGTCVWRKADPAPSGAHIFT
jgi:hypothetical protein